MLRFTNGQCFVTTKQTLIKDVIKEIKYGKCVTRNFLGRKCLLELRHFDKRSCATRERKAKQGKISSFFFLKTLKDFILNEKFHPKITAKLRHCFPIFENVHGETLTPAPLLSSSSYAPVWNGWQIELK